MSIFFHKGNADIVWLKGTVMLHSCHSGKS
jgi:hypothetical protein